jgi:general secretion pathway protein K
MSDAQKGSTLILVVWSIALLSLFAVAIGAQGAFSLEMENRLEQNLIASYMGLAGVHRAQQILSEDLTLDFDGLYEDWADNEARFSNWPFQGGRLTTGYRRADERAQVLTYGLLDVERKLNLNTVPPEVLVNLFGAVDESLSEAEVLALADAVADWRDEDNKKRPYGAEGFYYRARRSPYECKDGPLENMEELLLVRGMTPDLFKQLLAHVTVYGTGAVNLNTAGRTVLGALGLGPAAVDGIVFYRAGEDNVVGTEDDRVLTSLALIASEWESFMPQEDLALLAQLRQEELVGVSSSEFEVSVGVSLEGEEEERLHLWCVMDRTGGIQVWRER